MTGAVILAAGAGTRLGGVAKALLPTSCGHTFIAKIIESARAVATAQFVVVVGPPFHAAIADHVREFSRCDTRAPIAIVHNADPARGMASSIALGFAALGQTVCDRAWLWPVDHPHVAVDTLRALLRAIGDHAAARPVVAARGGHPPLVARSLFPGLAACEAHAGGARGVLANADVVAVAVSDVGTIRDVDTRQDLA